MKYKILRNIEIPEKRLKRIYPFDSMEIGDCFDVGATTPRESFLNRTKILSSARKRYKCKITTKCLPDKLTIRVWLMERKDPNHTIVENKTKYKIKKGITPEHISRSDSYPFEEMDYGDCFEIKLSSDKREYILIKQRLYAAGRKGGFKVVTRMIDSENNIFRVWKTKK